MSHFLTLVIVPQDSLDLEVEVRHRLAPYDINLQVESYFEECYCLNRLASRSAFDYAEQHAPRTLDEYRQLYDELRGKKPTWEQFTRAWQVVRDEAEQTHPRYQQFDPACEACQGSGTSNTTINSHGKWDWWQIGGRWTGALTQDYDPTKDIENQEWCDLCGGTGNRPDIQFYADPENIAATVYPVATNPSFAETSPPFLLLPLQMPQAGHQRVEWCNRCQGKGLRTKWPTQWKSFEGDIVPVQQIPATFCPYALVLPNGEWLEHEETVGVGIILREKDINRRWRQKVKETLAQYGDHIGVLVDCHG
jgi:hypothetical protein